MSGTSNSDFKRRIGEKQKGGNPIGSRPFIAVLALLEAAKGAPGSSPTPPRRYLTAF